MELSFSGTTQSVKIKVLLWRQDYSSVPGLNEFLYYDIEDVEDPVPELSWKKLVNTGAYEKWKTEWTKEAKNYTDQLWKATCVEPTKRLTSFPYDITDTIISLDPITSSMGFENSFSFSVDSTIKSALLEGIIENDIIAVLTKRNQDEKFKVEYIGFVTAITNTEIPKQINSFDITTFGLHKFLSLSRIIQLAGAWSQTEGTFEVTDPELQMFQTRWENKTVKEIMNLILEEVYNISKPVTEGTPSDDIYKYEYSLKNSVVGNPLVVQDMNAQLATNNKRLAEIDIVYKKNIGNAGIAAPLKEEEASLKKRNEELTKQVKDQDNDETQKKRLKLGFLFLYQYYTVREDLNSEIIISRKIQADYEPFPKTVATIEKASINPFNSMIASSLQKFYSQLAKPVDVLQNLKSITFYDIFEDRDGQLICRPPLYNQFGNDTSIEKGFINLQSTKVEAQKYIINKNKINRFTKTRNDIDMETRRDYRWIQRYHGSVDQVGGHFSDFLLTTKYGGRFEGPQDNALCQTIELAALFSAIDLTRSNAATRQINIEVENDRKYELGKLYYLPDYERVGYLINISENFNLEQGVTTNTLTFTYIRKVEKDSGIQYRFKVIPSINDLEFLNSELMKIAERNAIVMKNLQSEKSQNKPKAGSGAAMSIGGYYYAKKTYTPFYITLKNIFDTSGYWKERGASSWREQEDEKKIKYIQTPFTVGSFYDGNRAGEQYINQEFLNRLNDANDEMLKTFRAVTQDFYDFNNIDQTIVVDSMFYKKVEAEYGSTTVYDDTNRVVITVPSDADLQNVEAELKKDVNQFTEIPDYAAGATIVANLLMKNRGIIYMTIQNENLKNSLIAEFNLKEFGAYYIQETKIPSISNIMGLGGLLYGWKTTEDSTQGITDGTFSNPIAYDPHCLGCAIDIIQDFVAKLTDTGNALFRAILEKYRLTATIGATKVKQMYTLNGIPTNVFSYLHVQKVGFEKGV